MNWQNLQQHLTDLLKAVLAAAAMAAVQAIISYFAHYDWTQLGASTMQAAAAFLAVKTRLG